MKTRFYTLLAVAVILFAFTACEEKEEDKTVSVTIGAQANTTIDGFYAVGEDKTYTMTEAKADQANVDIFCFYEYSEADQIYNYTCLASPGSSITGIFTGEDAPETWTTLNVTRFFKTELTADEFDAVQENDALLYSLFLAADFTNKKAKDVQVDQVWAFHTADDYYGLIKITAVTHETNGSASFEIKKMYYEAPTK